MSEVKTIDTKVVTGKVRFSYANVWEATAMEEGQQKKYSVALLIPKSDKKTVAAIQKAIAAATEQGKNTKFGGTIPPKAKFTNPLRDGDEERPDDEVYAGHYFVNAKATTRPGVVDAAAKPILNQDEFYSGCYGRASVTFYPYNTNGNKGVAAGLNHVMKTEDGEPLGGRSTAESDFADVIEDDDLM
jgi:hypothetical protein